MFKQSILLTTTFITGLLAHAESKHDTHSMLKECSSYCPNAKDEHAMHKCMKKVIKEKKGDAAFEKSHCFQSVKEHEKNEKEHSH